MDEMRRYFTLSTAAYLVGVTAFFLCLIVFDDVSIGYWIALTTLIISLVLFILENKQNDSGLNTSQILKKRALFVVSIVVLILLKVFVL